MFEISVVWCNVFLTFYPISKIKVRLQIIVLTEISIENSIDVSANISEKDFDISLPLKRVDEAKMHIADVHRFKIYSSYCPYRKCENDRLCSNEKNGRYLDVAEKNEGRSISRKDLGSTSV